MKDILALICALAVAKADPVRTNIAYNEAEQAPIICAAANSDGILVAHENCNQFYQCWDGKPIARDCYGTLQYNPITEVCDWPDTVDCGGRAISEDGSTDNGSNGSTGSGNCDPSQAENICAIDGSNGTLVAHENCDKYYICDCGVPVVRECPGDLLFNPFKDYCDWPNNVDCGERVISEENKDTNDIADEGNNNDSNGNGNGESGNGENEGSGAGNCDPSEAGNICASEGSDGTLVAHENCNKYYICNHGVPVTQKCPGTLLFNPFKDYCDWPNKVDCGDRVISEESKEDSNGDGNESSENGNGESGNGENEGSGAGNCDPSEAVNICASEGSNGTLVAHENCNKYYICNHGVPVTQKCPGALLFDPFKDYCDWPDQVDCGDRVISEESEEDNNGDGNESSEYGNGESGNGENEGSGAGNCDPSEAVNICASEGSNGTLVAHENCNKYYICNHGVPVTQKCPGALLFDPFKDYCDWPDQVDCGDRVISEESEEDNNGDGNESSEYGNGESGNGENEGSGAGNCDPSEAVNICASEGSNGTLVAHENCNKYYICNHGVPVTQKCPGTLLFDPFKDYCDWPNKVDCGDRVISEESKEDSNGDGNKSSENGNGESGNGENEGSGAGNCDPSEAVNICASEGSNGTLVAHENCNKYYICNHGIPVVQQCPGTLLFDPFKDYCDWPDSVDCGDRIISEEKSEEIDEDTNSNENNGSDNEDTDSGDSENGGSGNGGSGNGDSSTCNCNPSEAPTICAVDGSDGKFVAHENCNQFYTCASGKPVTMTCPGSLLYNPYTQVCDWSDNVECGDRAILEIETEEENENTESDSSENGDSDNGNADNGEPGTCNCNPGEAPSICAADGSDGLFVAHENCNQFYTCAAGKPVTMTCPGSLLYNPYSQVCDWSDNVQCGDRAIPEIETEGENEQTEGGSSENEDSDNDDAENGEPGTCNCNPGEAPSICAADGSDSIVVAHENCNQFYTCAAGKPITMTCPGSLLYNPYTNVCDWSDNVQCGDRVIPDNETEKGNEDTESGSSENGSSDNGDADNGGSDNGEPGTCNCNPGEAPSICATDGSDGNFVAHENCNQFYTCSAGRPVTITCPGSLLYNPYTQVCDWSDNVQCGDRVIPDNETEKGNEDTESGSSENEDSDNDDADNGEPGTCNCNPGEAPSICAADRSEGEHVAHENCNQFYTCAAGKPVTMSCPGSLLYNPYTQVCDWSDKVQCGDRAIPEIETEGGNEDTEGSSSENGDSDNNDADNGEPGTCNCNPGEAPSICAADRSEGVHVAHENCNQFYTCAAGKPVTMTCSGSLLYNPYTQVCDWSDNVKCGDRAIPEIETEGGNEHTESGSSENEDSDNDDADNGEPGTCNCNPGEAPSICAADRSEGVHVAHENCNQFYTCVAGQPVTLTCPGSLLYNPYIGQCVWPDHIICGDRIISEDTNNNSTDHNVAGDEDTIIGNDDENKNNASNDNAEASITCAASGAEGMFLPHEKCNQFYVCNDSQAVIMNCSGMLLYNDKNKHCDWPENVDCGSRTV